MSWDYNTRGTGGFGLITSGNTNTTFATQVDAVATTTWDYPDPLIDWLPYKWEKYIPTWHLVRSYK